MASKPSGRGGGGGGGRGGGGGDGGGGSGSGGDSDGRRTGLSARAFGGAQPPPPPKQGKKRTAPAAPAAAAAAAAGSAAGDAASAAGSAHVTRSKQPRLAATDATARISAMLSDVAATRAADPRSTAVAAAAAGQTPCFNYHTEGGVCANGSLCNYSHGEVDPVRVSRAAKRGRGGACRACVCARVRAAEQALPKLGERSSARLQDQAFP